MSTRSKRSKKSSGSVKVVVTDWHPCEACGCGGGPPEQMVSCDECEKWHHHLCVGFVPKAEKQPWSCTNCKAAKGVQDRSSNGTKTPSQRGSQHDKQSVSSSRSSHAMLRLQLQKLEEERELERRQEAERAAKEKAFLERKYQLLAELRSEGSSTSGSVLSVCDHPKPNSPVPIPRGQQSLRNNSQHSNNPIPQNPLPVPLPQPGRYQVNDEDDLAVWPLTRKQLAARQAISKELPPFSGNPEEWPLFLSSFNHTTALCGFSEAENIIRLQKSLKGRAYEAVKSRLMHPANVSGVMSTLRMLFGQPEAIVHTLIGKINSLPAIREDRLETLVDFAVSVENFCATVDACGLEEHLYNVSLLHQLVCKLPPSIKLNWAQYRQTLPAVNLASFSRWLYSLAEAASAITVPNICGDVGPPRNETRGNKKSNTFVNAHSENVSSEKSSAKSSSVQTTSEHCTVCKGSCKTICKCKRFLEMSRASRWAVVNEFGLCRRCLKRHPGGCQAKLCGKNGCQYKHHELLHNDEKHSPTAGPSAPVSSNNTSSQASNSQQSTSASTGQGLHTHQVKSSSTLFRYLPVELHGKHGSVRTFAFLDDGSALTLLDSDLADELKLEGEVKPLCLHWTGGTQRQEDASRIVDLEVAGIQDGSKKFSLSGVRTVNELQPVVEFLTS